LRAPPTNNNKLLWWRYGSKPIENATPLHPAAAKSLPDAFSTSVLARTAVTTPQQKPLN
jgi:hypothetical protein